MRKLLGVVLAGSVSLVACGGDDGSGIVRNPGPTSAPDTSTGKPGSGGAPSSAGVACPATTPAATAISTTDTNATDVRLIAGFVVYRNDLKVIKVDPTGAARTELYASPDLVHSFADQDVLATIESPNQPDAVLKVMPAGATTDPNPSNDNARTVTPANWVAGGTTIFASDATSLYVLADVTNQGDTIYKVSKADPNQMTKLALLEGASLGEAQLAGTDVWFVREQKRVYKITQTADGADPTGALTAAPPTEVFGIGYADCKLAVGGSHAFCSTGKALEQRDLTGANVETIFDGQKGAAPSLLGAAIYGNDTVFVRTLPSGPTDALKNGIRAVKGTEAKLVACGREAVGAFAVDASSVVWAEKGKGIFRAPR